MDIKLIDALKTEISKASSDVRTTRDILEEIKQNRRKEKEKYDRVRRELEQDERKAEVKHAHACQKRDRLIAALKVLEGAYEEEST